MMLIMLNSSLSPPPYLHSAISKSSMNCLRSSRKRRWDYLGSALGHRRR